MSNNNNAAGKNAATNNSKPKSYTNKGNKFTPKGYMPPSMLKRFGLKENRPDIDVSSEKTDTRFTLEQTKRIKKMTELVVAYRMYSKQCSTETRLPSPLRNAVRYFSYPMSGFGAGGYNTSNKAGNNTAATEDNSAEDKAS